MLRDTISPIGQRFKQNADGTLLYLDFSRAKYLSSSREHLFFGSNNRNISVNRWLRTITNIPTNVSSYKLSRDGTIISTTVQTQNPANCTFHIRKNGDPSDISTTVLNGSSGIVNDNLNIDVDGDDWIQVYMSIQPGNVDYPVVTIEFAWRE